MTEATKQQLRRLLAEAMGKLIVLYEHRPSPIPVKVYRRYLQERWRYYGVDFLSFSFSTRFWLVISENSKEFDLINRNTELINFIESELAVFFNQGYIPTGSYIVESGFTDGTCLFCPQFQSNQSHHILQRLLEIAIVHGIEEAVLAFDRSSCSEGVHGIFQYVSLVEGIRVEADLQIFEGVRLVPLPSLKTTTTAEEVVQYLPGFPANAFSDQAASFFGKALLVIDCPGFSLFHKTPRKPFESGMKTVDLPFQVEEHDFILSNRQEINDFIGSYFKVLCLVCNSPVQIDPLGWFLKDDKSIHYHNGTIRTRYPFLERGPFRSSTEAGRSEIDKAMNLYNLLINSDSNIGEKLQIPINRWIRSTTSKTFEDKIIDLAIALESLYLLDRDAESELSFQLRLRASWFLGKDKTRRQALMKDFSNIYDWRSKVVHTGKLPKKTKKTPFTQREIEEFVENTQDLCRDSIMKILEEGECPDWNNLILG